MQAPCMTHAFAPHVCEVPAAALSKRSVALFFSILQKHLQVRGHSTSSSTGEEHQAHRKMIIHEYPMISRLFMPASLFFVRQV